MAVIDLNKIRTEKHWTNRLKDGVKRFGNAVVRKVGEAIEFVRENPQAAATLVAAGGALIGGVHRISKDIIKHQNLKQEKYNKEMYVYDHSLNLWLKYKRPLTAEDYENIAQLRKQGMKLNEALLALDLMQR